MKLFIVGMIGSTPDKGWNLLRETLGELDAIAMQAKVREPSEKYFLEVDENRGQNNFFQLVQSKFGTKVTLDKGTIIDEKITNGPVPYRQFRINGSKFKDFLINVPFEDPARNSVQKMDICFQESFKHSLVIAGAAA